MKTVVGLFDSLGEAQSAARDLITAGYSRDDIGLLASDATAGTLATTLLGALTSRGFVAGPFTVREADQ